MSRSQNRKYFYNTVTHGSVFETPKEAISSYMYVYSSFVIVGILIICAFFTLCISSICWILSISSFFVCADSAREVGYSGSGMTVLSCSMNSSLISMLQSQTLCQKTSWSISSMKNLDIPASGQHCADVRDLLLVQTAFMSHVCYSRALHRVPPLTCITFENLLGVLHRT